MSLEESLDRNSKALDAHTAALLSTKGSAAAVVPAAEGARKPGRPKKVTIAEVKAAAEKIKEAKGRPAAVALIAKHGAETIADMDESKYPAFIAACDVLLQEEEPPEEEAGEDDSL